jgi:hypothetical protein
MLQLVLKTLGIATRDSVGNAEHRDCVVAFLDGRRVAVADLKLRLLNG